jgi:hypothetical protein
LPAKAKPAIMGAMAAAAMPYFRAAVKAVSTPPQAADQKVPSHSARVLAM